MIMAPDTLGRALFLYEEAYELLTIRALCFKICSLSAEVAELVDAHGSGPCGSNLLRVQVPSSALK